MVLQSGLVICVVEPLSCLKQYELFANLFEGIKNEMPPGLVKCRDEKNYFNLFDLKSKNNIYIKQLPSLILRTSLIQSMNNTWIAYILLKKFPN